MRDRFRIKWIIEGTAAVFESMYLRDFEEIPNYHKTAQIRHASNEDFGSGMEHYENPDVNYGTSTAMVLFACKSFGFQRMIDFWKRHPTDQNWKNLFAETFEISVEEFYQAGKSAEFEQLSLEKMGRLTEIHW